MDQFSFINLQYGNTQQQVNDFNIHSNSKIINIDKVDLFNDFESIAAILQNLDLFISVSNSTAHLAGALGIPTWIIKPRREHAVLHYWSHSGKSTPWYSSIRLFENNYGWEKTIDNVKKTLIKKFK